MWSEALIYYVSTDYNGFCISFNSLAFSQSPLRPTFTIFLIFFSFISFSQKETSVAGFSITAMLEAQQKNAVKM